MHDKNYPIRWATLQDAEAIAHIHVQSWQVTYRGQIPDHVLDTLSIAERTKKWRELIAKGFKILVISHAATILGFASLNAARDVDLNKKTCGEISSLYLHPQYLRHGLGRQLCVAACEHLAKMGYKEIILWVLETNLVARQFYTAMGFRQTQKTKNYENYALQEIRYYKNLQTLFTYQALDNINLELLVHWLQKPHVKKWWDSTASANELKEKYAQRIGATDIICQMISYENNTIGYIQYYKLPADSEKTLGIDFFIGEEICLNKGIGTQLLQLFCKKLFTETAANKILVDVNPDNQIALRCFQKSGFQMLDSSASANMSILVLHK